MALALVCEAAFVLSWPKFKLGKPPPPPPPPLPPPTLLEMLEAEDVASAITTAVLLISIAVLLRIIGQLHAIQSMLRGWSQTAATHGRCRCPA